MPVNNRFDFVIDIAAVANLDCILILLSIAMYLCCSETANNFLGDGYNDDDDDSFVQ